MKTHRICLALARVSVALVVLGTTSRLLAIAGMADTVIIAADMTDTFKWSRELAQWESVIENTSREIEKADAMIKLVGDPKAVVQEFIDSVPDLMKPIDDAIGLETRQHALAMANGLYHLNSVAVQIYKDANKVAPEYEAFGEMVKRDPKRYTHYVMEEAMNARYKQAVANAEKAEKTEMAVQRKALEGLKSATTQSQIAVFTGVIAASKERLDLAHAKATQAKGELDAFHGQLGVEDGRKAEADREWAQTVVTEMRQKALKAYQAQFASNGDGSDN